MGQWYCIIVNPNCQRRAEAELVSKGYRVFWPKKRKWASHARTKTAKEYPLLGRYVFVEVHDGEFGPVRSANGVEGFVAVGGWPVPMPTRTVESFLERYMRGEWDEVSNARLPIGARIRIMEGEFEDMLATVLGRKNGKLRVLPRGQFAEVRIREQSARAA